ncbi:GOLPH3/VPS74 family protein [Thermobispora bispora]|uniref:GOLPH3/VPS74 family protein n=1 Tax=Thermobispora bispora TaxID=2006 RepID=UPI000A0589A5|nr:GPP34 family phosphoprotein [Thermobispora bispora]MBO2472831.1 hypothetical protein [Actinomycetales bacterium]QSI47426.1 GPP34 family phosphoprotein [Thermobispora bispora]
MTFPSSLFKPINWGIRLTYVAEVDHRDTRLADDLYFVVHHDRTGRMRLHPRLIDLGLAAAILGELMLAGRITVQEASGQPRVVPVDPEATGDAVTQRALDHIVAEPFHPFRVWLEFLAKTARRDVADRMAAAGLLHPPGRGLRRRWVPVDPDVAVIPTGRLNLAIQYQEPMSTQESVLLGLVVATGAAKVVLWDPGSGHIRATIASLPPPYRELIAQTTAAVGGAVLSRR